MLLCASRVLVLACRVSTLDLNSVVSQSLVQLLFPAVADGGSYSRFDVSDFTACMVPSVAHKFIGVHCGELSVGNGVGMPGGPAGVVAARRTGKRLVSAPAKAGSGKAAATGAGVAPTVPGGSAAGVGEGEDAGTTARYHIKWGESGWGGGEASSGQGRFA